MSASNPIGEALTLLIEYAKDNGRMKSRISLLEYEILTLKDAVAALKANVNEEELNHE